MYPMFPDVTHDWATPLGQEIKKLWSRVWAWWLATYVKFPLLRPVRYVYFISYTYGPGIENRYGSSGNGMAEIFSSQPLRSMNDVHAVRDYIVQNGSWPGLTTPAVVVQNWKLLRKQVFRQKTWHDTRRQPRAV